MKTSFAITYEDVTPESAEHGDASARGFIAESLTLREAYARLRHEGHAIEDDGSLRWLTFAPFDLNIRTGETRSLSLHFPDDITPSSALRVARLFGYEPRAVQLFHR